MNHDHGGHAGHAGHMIPTTPSTMNHSNHVVNKIIASVPVHSGHASHMQHMMMAMTFHGGFTEKILFDCWNTETIGAFIGSWFIVFFVAILYEGLKTVRDHLAKQEVCRQYPDENNRQSPLVRQHDQPYDRPNNTDLIPRVRTETNRPKRARLLSTYHIIQTLLHVLQMGISYLLMLVAMTFNTYLFLAVIFGAGLGHFLFGWRRSSIIDYNEHCH
ncbi:unnamed protein product [Adineta steineri]|uniref:Copper transport protein n=1 Tax=Adineta steineri TaxID=433720 RepID=A0A814TME9_9BILA|nr:unnamed protein product [Adineta steineri]CAF1161773.1 unnamed protein product [Adineta steineri]